MYPWERYELHDNVTSFEEVVMYDSVQKPDLQEVRDIAARVNECRKTDVTLVHCFPPDTLIGAPTPTTFESADKVYGKDGQLHDVTYHHSSHYNGDLIEIQADGLLPIKVTPEHPVLVVKPYRYPSGFVAKPNFVNPPLCVKSYYEGLEPEWIEAKDISLGDYLVCPKPVFGSSEVAEWIENTGVNGGYVLNELTPSPDNAWMLGLFVADGATAGGSGVNFTLSPNDDIDRLVDVWKGLGANPKIHNHGTYVRVTVGSTVAAKSFREWCGKSEEKQFPSFVFNGEWDIRSVMDGYAAGDGYLDEAGRLTCHTISPKLAEQARCMLLSLGEYPCVSLAPRHSGYPNTKQGYNVYWHTKAQQRRNIWHNGQYLSAVRSLTTSLYDGEVVNVAVEDVESYTVNGAVFHNCQAGLNRSNLIAGAALIREGMEAEEAISLLRSKRSPAVLCNQTFERWLYQKQEALRA